MSQLLVTLPDSPSGGRRTLYDNKEYPGCMGGLMHLFDFNQALAGRKLLTDKKFGAGLEAPRNSLDVGGSIPDASKGTAGRNEEVLYGNDLQKASVTKKSSGLSMKALIAEELSKESDNNNRAPGVVARLMGLDVMPTESKALQKPSAGIAGKMDEKFAHKSVVDRQRRGESSHAFRLYAKKSKAPSILAGSPARSVHSERDDDEDGKSVSRSLPLRSHPQEQQLQEFKKEFEAWQSRKSVALPKRSARMEDVHTHRTDKEANLRKKLYHPNAPFPQDGFPSSRINAAQGRLHESREFQDALDFLHSNKEFFMRFLQEPNSLFGKHLQENDAGSLHPPEPPEATKSRRHHHQVPDLSEGSRPQSWVKEYPLPRRSYKGDLPKSRIEDGFVERSVLSVPVSPLAVGSEGPLQDRHRHAYSPVTSENRLQNADYHIPTRIVVLKPSPGRVHNVKSSSPVYPRSPKEYMANDVFREDSTAVLERLREKLRKDSNRESKLERRNGRQTHHEHYRETSKDPREIAQEIVRQVRESITKDLVVDTSRMRNTARDVSLGRRSTQSSEFRDSIGIPDAEAYAPTYKPYRGSTRSMVMSMLPDKTNGVEGLFRSKEQKIKSIEQLKSKGRRDLDGSNSLGHEGMPRNGLVYVGGHSPTGSKTPQTPKESGGYHMDGSQPHLRVLSQKNKSQVEDLEDPEGINVDLDLEGTTNVECREQTEASSPSWLLRSCSTNGAASDSGTPAEFQLLGGLAHLRGSTEPGSEIVAESAVTELITPLDADEHPMDPVTSSSHNLASWDVDGDDAVQEEVKQTILVREEQSGPQSVEDVAMCSSIEQQHLTHNIYSDLPASPCSTSVSWGASSTGDPVLVDKDGTVLVVTSDTCLEVLGASSSNDQGFTHHDTTVLDVGDACLGGIKDEAPGSDGTSQILEVALENDALVLPINPPASPHLVSDGAEILHSEPVKENLEQPSPVSVLDLPFQDDTPVSMEFKELSSDLEELRVRIRLLKFEDGGNDQGKDQESEPNADTYPHGCAIVREDSCSEEALDNLAQMNEGDTLHLNAVDGGMEERSSPRSGREEMLYVKRVLGASGFTSDSATILTRWHAPNQPLNPRLFQKLEDSLADKDKELEELDEAVSNFSSREERVDLSQRHLLFDCVNEVLLDILGPHFNRRPWSSSPKRSSALPPGDELLELVWSHVWCLLCSHSETQDTLENLVKKDLGKGGRWSDVGVEAEAVGLEVERAILDDLIEESLLVL